jgi:hypothetical protein
MLAAVPSCAGQCRFVRGFSVGIAAADADLRGFCGDARGPVSRLGGPPGLALRQPIVDVAMPEETTGGAEAEPTLLSLVDKVNWLIDTGERVSYTTIWKLRNGQAAKPQMKLIEALARAPAAAPLVIPVHANGLHAAAGAGHRPVPGPGPDADHLTSILGTLDDQRRQTREHSPHQLYHIKS